MIGDVMVYRSLYSGEFKAVVTAVRFAGMAEECVDLDVFNGSGSRLMHATRIRVSDRRIEGEASAYFGDRPAP